MNANDYKVQKERGLYRKLKLIEYLGGKCKLCGYDKSIAALEFHHKDPENKSFQLDSRHLSNTNIEKIIMEVDKCVLLCSNCHKEIHYPSLNKEKICDIIEEHNHIDVTKSKRRQSECPVCHKTFDANKGKKFCSKECRDKFSGRDKYPSKEDLDEKYKELKSWSKVADFFGITRKITQTLRKME